MGAVLGVLLRNYGFTDLPPSLHVPRSDPVTRIYKSSYRRVAAPVHPTSLGTGRTGPPHIPDTRRASRAPIMRTTAPSNSSLDYCTLQLQKFAHIAIAQSVGHIYDSRRLPRRVVHLRTLQLRPVAYLQRCERALLWWVSGLMLALEGPRALRTSRGCRPYDCRWPALGRRRCPWRLRSSSVRRCCRRPHRGHSDRGVTSSA